MFMKLAVMTGPFKAFVDQKEALKIIKDLGFDAADVTVANFNNFSQLDEDIFDGDYILKAKELKEYADSINLPLIQAHAPFPVYIDNDDEYNSNMMIKLQKSIEVCGILGIKNVVIHPNNNWDKKRNALFFKELIPFAKKYHVIICTENMWNWDKEHNHVSLAACSSPIDYLNHIKEVNDEYLEACVDVGHANMFSMVDKAITPGNMVRTLNKHVKCFHIHDNDGIHDNHETPFTMTLDWEDLARAIKEINYQGDLVIEIVDRDIKSLDEMIAKHRLQYEAGKKLIDLINK